MRIGSRILGLTSVIGRGRFERLKERVTQRLLATAVARAERTKRLRRDTEREFIEDRREG